MRTHSFLILSIFLVFGSQAKEIHPYDLESFIVITGDSISGNMDMKVYRVDKLITPFLECPIFLSYQSGMIKDTYFKNFGWKDSSKNSFAIETSAGEFILFSRDKKKGWSVTIQMAGTTGRERKTAISNLTWVGSSLSRILSEKGVEKRYGEKKILKMKKKGEKQEIILRNYETGVKHRLVFDPALNAKFAADYDFLLLRRQDRQALKYQSIQAMLDLLRDDPNREIFIIALVPQINGIQISWTCYTPGKQFGKNDFPDMLKLIRLE